MQIHMAIDHKINPSLPQGHQGGAQGGFSRPTGAGGMGHAMPAGFKPKPNVRCWL